MDENPDQLRKEVGEIIGANLDPSHLFWQGIDILTAINELKGAISIEHEDGLMEAKEGLEKAVDFIKGMIIRNANENMWWA